MLSLVLYGVIALELAHSSEVADGDAKPYSIGDPRNCEVGLSADSKFFRMEVLPGLGWDNLRNLDQSIVLAYNYSQCKSTNDRKYLIPDDTFVIPLQRSKVDTYSEIVSHSLNYTSMTATSINVGFSAFSVVSGKFSADFQEAKGHFYKDRSVLSRSQIRHLRYIIKSSPDAQLNPAFKSRLWEIASELQSSNPKMARYLAELLIRDYGTHYVHTTYAGAILAQEDFLKDTYISSFARDSSSVSASTSANFFGKVGFSFGVSHSSSEETQKTYTSNTTYSHVLTHGGPPFQSKFDVNMWEQGIDNALVAIDREGDPIHYAITPQNVPEVPPTTVIRVAELVKHAAHSYYRHNTHKGCTDPSARNFDYHANIDDKSCKAPAMNFTFGGVFQTCEKTTTDSRNPICPGLLQENPLSKGYSCPHPYTAVLLNTGTKGTTYKVTSCHKSCHGATFKHCSTNCVTNTIYSGARYKTYWCVALGKVPPQTGYLFGGVFTSTMPNPLTRTQECPAHYISLRFGEDGHVCVSSDYELGYEFSQPFTGFDSCSVGNPLAVDEKHRSTVSSTWPKICPLGFSQHLVMVDDSCEVNFCLKAGVLNDQGVIPIRRPPFMKLPVRSAENVTIGLFTVNGEVWVRDESNPVKWDVMDPNSEAFFNRMKDAGLVNGTYQGYSVTMETVATPTTVAQFSQSNPASSDSVLSAGAAAGIGITSTVVLGLLVLAAFLFGMKINGYRNRKKALSGSTHEITVGYQSLSNNSNDGTPPDSV